MNSIGLTPNTIEALASTAASIDRELRDPSLNPRLTPPIPPAVLAAWAAYAKRLKTLIASQSPIDKRPRCRPSPASLLAAFDMVEKAVGADRALRAAIRFHGAVLRMAFEPRSRRSRRC